MGLFELEFELCGAELYGNPNEIYCCIELAGHDYWEVPLPCRDSLGLLW
jgi:hypothetical protein